MTQTVQTLISIVVLNYNDPFYQNDPFPHPPGRLRWTIFHLQFLHWMVHILPTLFLYSITLWCLPGGTPHYPTLNAPQFPSTLLASTFRLPPVFTDPHFTYIVPALFKLCSTPHMHSLIHISLTSHPPSTSCVPPHICIHWSTVHLHRARPPQAVFHPTYAFTDPHFTYIAPALHKLCSTPHLHSLIHSSLTSRPPSSSCVPPHICIHWSTFHLHRARPPQAVFHPTFAFTDPQFTYIAPALLKLCSTPHMHSLIHISLTSRPPSSSYVPPHICIHWSTFHLHYARPPQAVFHPTYAFTDPHFTYIAPALHKLCSTPHMHSLIHISLTSRPPSSSCVPPHTCIHWSTFHLHHARPPQAVFHPTYAFTDPHFTYTAPALHKLCSTPHMHSLIHISLTPRPPSSSCVPPHICIYWSTFHLHRTRPPQAVFHPTYAFTDPHFTYTAPALLNLCSTPHMHSLIHISLTSRPPSTSCVPPYICIHWSTVHWHRARPPPLCSTPHMHSLIHISLTSRPPSTSCVPPHICIHWSTFHWHHARLPQAVFHPTYAFTDPHFTDIAPALHKLCSTLHMHSLIHISLTSRPPSSSVFHPTYAFTDPHFTDITPALHKLCSTLHMHSLIHISLTSRPPSSSVFHPTYAFTDPHFTDITPALHKLCSTLHMHSLIHISLTSRPPSSSVFHPTYAFTDPHFTDITPALHKLCSTLHMHSLIHISLTSRPPSSSVFHPTYAFTDPHFTDITPALHKQCSTLHMHSLIHISLTSRPPSSSVFHPTYAFTDPHFTDITPALHKLCSTLHMHSLIHISLTSRPPSSSVFHPTYAFTDPHFTDITPALHKLCSTLHMHSLIHISLTSCPPSTSCVPPHICIHWSTFHLRHVFPPWSTR